MGKPEEKHLKFKDKVAAYYVTGEGSPLILMHGWGCTHETVSSLASVGESKGYKVYNLDFPGFGNSEEPVDVWGVNEYTELIEAIIERESITRPVMIGHSFGGRVAINFASRNECDKIILVDSAGLVNKSLKKRIKIGRFKILKKIMSAFLSKDKYEEWADKFRKRHGSADYAAASQKMRQILSKVVNDDLSEKLRLIKAPVLLMWGTADTATPLKDAKRMERLIPDAGIVEFEGAGHYSFLDQPHKFRAVLGHFLTKNS